MSGALHLIKLSVGTGSVADLEGWQARRAAQEAREGRPARPFHATRMRPRRGEELLAGGSIYWVIKGLVQARQRILALDDITGADGIVRCAIRLDPQLIRTEPVARKAFQGWRYLKAGEAPPDLGAEMKEDGLPYELEHALSLLGVRARS